MSMWAQIRVHGPLQYVNAPVSFYMIMQVPAVLSSWWMRRRKLAALPLRKLYCSILLRPGGFGAAFTQGATLKTARYAMRYLLSMR